MSLQRTKTGMWAVRWSEGTRQRSRSFSLKNDARSFEALVTRTRERGEQIPAKTGPPLNSFFIEWLASKRGLAKRTKGLYEGLYADHVMDSLGHLPLNAITPRTLDKWQDQRIRAGAGPEAVSKAGKLLHQVFAKAIRQELVGRNPAAHMERPRPTHREIIVASPEQIEGIRGYFLQQGRVGDAVLISVMSYTGLRFGEALALQWPDFLRAEALWVTRSLEDDGSFKPTKTNESRLVDLPDPIARELLRWRTALGHPEGLMFPRASDGRGWRKTDRNNWRRRYFNPAATFAGLENFPPKNLRHSCASLMIAAGRPSTEVADHMGHSLATSVRVYQRFMKEMKGQEVRPVEEHIAAARGIREVEASVR